MDVFDHVVEFVLLPDETHLADLQLILELADEGIAGGDFFLGGNMQVSVVFPCFGQLVVKGVDFLLVSVLFVDEIGDLLCGVFGQVDVLLLLITDDVVQVIDVSLLSSDDVLEPVGLALEGCSQVLQFLVFDHGFMEAFVLYLLLLHLVKAL